jgi:multiple antibiotic resistance protein
LLCWLVLRAADRLVVRLGRTGIQIASRIMGLMLAAVAVQFVITGVKDALAS